MPNPGLFSRCLPRVLGTQPAWAAGGRMENAAGSRTRSRFNVRRHAPAASLIGKVNSERLQLFKLI